MRARQGWRRNGRKVDMMLGVRILAAAVCAAGLLGPERAEADVLNFAFDLQTQRVYDRLSGVTHPGSPLLSETGTASLTVNVHADGYTFGDPVPLSAVTALQIDIFGGTFGPGDLSVLTGSPPFSGPAFLATIEADPTEGLQMTQLYFGVTETMAAGSLTFDPAHLTEIPAPGVSAFVAQFDGALSPGADTPGIMEVSVAKWGVVPAPPALPLALAAFGGLAVVARRGRGAAGREGAAP
jgi:hypothetical protein